MMNDEILILVIGLQCSGKTTFLHVAKDCGYLTYEWSDIFSDSIEGNRRDDKLTDVIRLIHGRGRLHYPNKIITELLMQSKKQDNLRGYVLSGVRHPCELSYIMGRFVNARIIYIHSDVTIRYNRCKERSREGDPQTLDEFIIADSNELQTGLAAIISEYKHDLIENSGFKKQFEQDAVNYLAPTERGD